MVHQKYVIETPIPADSCKVQMRDFSSFFLRTKKAPKGAPLYMGCIQLKKEWKLPNKKSRKKKI